MAGRSIMHGAHTADVRQETIFIHNGAPRRWVAAKHPPHFARNLASRLGLSSDTRKGTGGDIEKDTTGRRG